jgi:hypothetical protein
MNLQNFKKDYLNTISESKPDTDLKNYIRAIVEATIAEAKTGEPIVSSGFKLSDIVSSVKFKKSLGGVEGEHSGYEIIIEGNKVIIMGDAQKDGFQQKVYKLVFDSEIE